MGRRKERRLAAKTAAGRRVKLDLSFEPSVVGEVDGPLSQAKVGGDNDLEERTGAPSSPSSSEQNQENPLFLLGQYSDDEVEDKSGNEESHIFEEISSVAVGSRVNEHIVHNKDNKKNGKDAVSSIVKFEVECMDAEKSIDGRKVEKNYIVSSDSFIVTDNAIKTSFPDASVQTIKDASSGWKVVMDEESKQYYYWNTLTGQTSWESPDILLQSVALSSEQMISMEEQNPSNESLKCNSNISTDNGISNTALEYMNGYAPTGYGNAENANVAFDSSQVMHNFMTSNGELCVPQGDEERNIQVPSTSYEAPPDIQLDQLVLQCESLLQNLKALEWSEEMSKYASEIETRLMDCKALSSFGSSILPFWSHTKTQLDRLEIVIAKLIHDNAKFKHQKKNNNDDESFSLPAAESEPAKLDNKTLSTSEELEGCNAGVANENIKKDNHKSLLLAESCVTPESPDKEIIQVNETAPPGVECRVSQDIDMDVEMEVDEETSTDNPAIGNSSCIECSDVVEKYVESTSPSQSVPSAPLNNLNVPPPPDEEWIPPPPPDDEPIPPLPPEGAPLVSPFPYGEAAQSFSYTGQYNLGYSIPTFQYYTHAEAETQGNHYYAPTDITQIAELQQIQQYCEQPVVSNSYTRVSAEPVLYYNHPNETSAPTVLPENTIVEMGTALFYPQTGSFGLPTLEASCEVVNATEDVGIPTNCHSITAGLKLDATPTASVKNPSKGPSKKKRTIAIAPTFHSNKKVSNLVDKWNAAKELLHEDEEEEEPDNAYEALEKKRQKEIEEWRAQQIASGEALDNANFLPLGSDWRKRVKRKRARLNASESTSSLEDDVNERKPDLVELSKGLPSAWKVYFDESSNEVYYGNQYTSETTWTRPTS